MDLGRVLVVVFERAGEEVVGWLGLDGDAAV